MAVLNRRLIYVLVIHNKQYLLTPEIAVMGFRIMRHKADGLVVATQVSSTTRDTSCHN